MLEKIKKYAKAPWYVFLIAFLLAADHFILILPADLLAVSAMVGKRKGVWWRAAVLALGSSLGILLIAILVHSQVHFSFQNVEWIETFFKNYGLWAILLLGAMPVPQQPQVILAALAEIPSFEIFIMCLIGRLIKFEFYGWISHKIIPKKSHKKSG